MNWCQENSVESHVRYGLKDPWRSLQRSLECQGIWGLVKGQGRSLDGPEGFWTQYILGNGGDRKAKCGV